MGKKSDLKRGLAEERSADEQPSDEIALRQCACAESIGEVDASRASACLGELLSRIVLKSRSNNKSSRHVVIGASSTVTSGERELSESSYVIQEIVRPPKDYFF